MKRIDMNLQEYLTKASKKDLNYIAKVMYDTSWYEPVVEEYEYINNEKIFIYKFKDKQYPPFYEFENCRIIRDDKILIILQEHSKKEFFIMVVWTEPEYRNQGRITKELILLKEEYKIKRKTLIVDTYTDSLIYICGKLKIKLFREKQKERLKEIKLERKNK